MNDEGEAIPFSPKGVREKKEPRWVTSNAPSGGVQPAWVRYFLRALERTGVARAAAEDAGVDYTTVYARRRAHADFAAAWAEALKTHEAAKKRREKEEGEAMVEGVRKARPLSPLALRASRP